MKKNLYFLLVIIPITLSGQKLKINYKSNSKYFTELNNRLYFNRKPFNGILFENLSNESPKYIYNYTFGKRDGIQLEYNPDNGKLMSSENYVKGRADGEFVFYNDFGNIRSKGIVLHDERGEIENFTTYYNNGQIESIIKQINKKREGLFISYYENGQIEEQVFFKDGVAEGDVIRYYENGNISEKGKMVNGNKIREWNSYYENGKPETNGSYCDGGLKCGLWREWDTTNIVSIGNYREGKKVGEWTTYGQIWTKIKY